MVSDNMFLGLIGDELSQHFPGPACGSRRSWSAPRGTSHLKRGKESQTHERFISHSRDPSPSYVAQKLYGRGYAVFTLGRTDADLATFPSYV